MCVTNIFTLCYVLTPGSKFNKIGDDLLPTQIYHPAKFQLTHAGDIRYRKNLRGQTNEQTLNDINPQHARRHVVIKNAKNGMGR